MGQNETKTVRPTESELLQGAGKPLQQRFPPQARTTAVTISAVQISRTGPDGLPALPSGSREPVHLTHIDPEGRGRTIGQQLDDMLAKAELQALEEWK